TVRSLVHPNATVIAHGRTPSTASRPHRHYGLRRSRRRRGAAGRRSPWGLPSWLPLRLRLPGVPLPRSRRRRPLRPRPRPRLRRPVLLLLLQPCRPGYHGGAVQPVHQPVPLLRRPGDRRGQRPHGLLLHRRRGLSGPVGGSDSSGGVGGRGGRKRGGEALRVRSPTLRPGQCAHCFRFGTFFSVYAFRMWWIQVDFLGVRQITGAWLPIGPHWWFAVESILLGIDIVGDASHNLR
uniref:Uncharacterized protein n=1 Tax=Aegilops tauschii subsp. strangulata TaxID=200361 RepID=A0A453ALV1_AEGTS